VAEGKAAQKALRALKRQVSDAIYKQQTVPDAACAPGSPHQERKVSPGYGTGRAATAGGRLWMVNVSVVIE